MEKFWKLKVFHKAHQLVLEIYKLTNKFPNEEKFGLISQIRRAVVSIVANIVEATKRRSNKEKRNFHSIAEGSLEEVKYYLYLSYELKFTDKKDIERIMNLAREVGAMLTGLNKSLDSYKP